MERLIALLKNRMTVILLIIVTLLVLASVMIVNMIDDITGNINMVKKAKVPGYEAVIGEDFTGDSDKAIKEMVDHDPRANELNLTGHTVSAPTLAYVVRTMPRLKILSLRYASMPVKALISLPKLPLELVDLNDTSVGDEGAKIISNIPTLHTVRLESAGITDDAFTYLSKLPNLKDLNVAQNEITDEAVRRLAPCAGRLQRFWAAGSHFTRKTTEELQNFPQLLSLDVGQCGLTADDLSLLSENHSLRILIMRDQDFKGENLTKLAAALSQVEELGLDGSNLTNKQFMELGKMKNLKRLFVPNCKSVSASTVTEFKKLHPAILVGH